METPNGEEERQERYKGSDGGSTTQINLTRFLEKLLNIDSRLHCMTRLGIAPSLLDRQECLSAKSKCKPRKDVPEKGNTEDTGLDD